MNKNGPPPPYEPPPSAPPSYAQSVGVSPASPFTPAEACKLLTVLIASTVLFNFTLGLLQKVYSFLIKENEIYYFCNHRGIKFSA